MLTFFDNIQQEWGACGRHENKVKREHNDFQLCLIILLENGSCGRYNNTHKSIKQLDDGFITSLSSEFIDELMNELLHLLFPFYPRADGPN